MADRPILFSAPMVRALLAGRKTQTRRLACSGRGELVRWDPDTGLAVFRDSIPDDPARVERRCPWKVGDLLWVRETWAVGRAFDRTRPGEIPCIEPREIPVWYRGDVERDPDGEESRANRGRWRSPLFMPRWASRLTLEIAEVRVQRLQEITEEDACAEGVLLTAPHYRTGFATLWDRINGKRAIWSSNPWVWALSFRRVAESRRG